MPRVNVRCSVEKCKTRHVFARHPDEYQIPRRCERCGGTKFRVIRDMRKDRGKSTLCDCAGYQWVKNYQRVGNAPHRRGSPACWYDKDGTIRPPSEDEQ